MVGALVTVLILVIDFLAAYAYARMEFPGRGVLFALLLATLFLPGMMFLVPNFLTIFTLHLLNNYLGVILPGLAGVFGVFFLRQFFETIPKELEEAAVHRRGECIPDILPGRAAPGPARAGHAARSSPSWPVGTTSCGRCSSCSRPIC